MGDNVLVIGAAGREHAIAWKLAHSENVGQVYVCPGNAGTSFSPKIRNAVVDLHNHSSVAKWCRDYDIKLVVVGPEDPLANGLADSLKLEGIKCFGPSKNAAMIEASKEFAKSFMDRNNIPTAKWKAFADVEAAKSHILSVPYPALVVKASGLAGGKGVVVADSKDEAIKAVESILSDRIFGTAGDVVVIEERIVGEEISVLCFTDGETIAVMPPAQDHKRLLDGDEGPNTGGMGAYCPYPLITPKQLDWIKTNVLQATVSALKKEGRPFVGVLFAGLMLTSDGPKVLEFNCRFGDPETEVILPLLESDLYSVMISCVTNNLHNQAILWKSNTYAVGIVLASQGYPGHYVKDIPISGINEVLSRPRQLVFHSGTRMLDEQLVTSGGRVLLLVSWGSELLSTISHAKSAAKAIEFDGKQYRNDIGQRAATKLLSRRISLSYKSSGVDIQAGDSLVHRIQPLTERTSRSGVMGSIGGFGGLFDLKDAGFKDPLLVSGTDGVGTKLKIAHEVGVHDTIGIDLVAMCANDVLANGGVPLYFLDYFACGKLDVDIAAKVIDGIAKGCEMAGCALIGGETAEMPSMYAPKTYDLAGFVVGAVERDLLLPRVENITSGDVVIGIASSGLHSNGFSLIRKIIENNNLKFNQPAPFNINRLLSEELLIPTKIYAKLLLPIIQSRLIKAYAHITGGGLLMNIPRVLPSSLGVVMDATNWEIPPVFGWVASESVSDAEMLRTFNCGLGAVLIVSAGDEEKVLHEIHRGGEEAWIVGSVVEINDSQPQVNVINFGPHLKKSYTPDPSLLMKPTSVGTSENLRTKKVCVLISGIGTNLQALIDHTMDPVNQSPAKIELVISNIPTAAGLRRAEKAGIATLVVNHKDYQSRLEFDMAIHDILIAHQIDVVCLAGFMRVLTGDFVRLWNGRLLNVHPSLLPAFRGMNAQRQALEARVRVTGCTVHYVAEEVDAGAIIVQEVVPIGFEDTLEVLEDRIRQVEHKAYPKALDLVTSGKASLGTDGNIIWKV